MRLLERIEDWPIEEWAASAARIVRRVRRRASRRRSALAGLTIALAVGGVVAGNALWRQTAPHPAPLWSAEDAQDTAVIAVAAHDGVAEEPARERSGLVEKLQDGLAANGFFAGTATGILDQPTRAAIRAFERAQGLPETGEPSVGLLAAVSSRVRAVEPSAERNARDVSDLSISEMQRLLNERGFGPLTVDGLMGPKTRAALERFADANGIATTDLRSPAVMRALAAGGA